MAERLSCTTLGVRGKLTSMNCAACSKPIMRKSTRGPEPKYCSINCRNNVKVTEWRRRTKERGVELLGGKCVRCGYDKNVAALVFHHKRAKSFGVSKKGITRAWSKIEKELKKCVLLCLNCHAEEHQAHRNV